MNGENGRMNGVYVKALPEWWRVCCPKCGHSKLHNQECEWCTGHRTHEHDFKLVNVEDDNIMHYKCSVCGIERTVTIGRKEKNETD